MELIKNLIKLLKLVKFFYQNWHDEDVRAAFALLYDKYEAVREILDD